MLTVERAVMNPASQVEIVEQKKTSGVAPALTLIFLSPFIAEVLSGATRMSAIFALVPEMMLWGCGALIARELVRRWGGGWPSLLMLGLGLSIAEEFLIQQTSLAPIPFPGVMANYGRLWGVNWIYFLFMLAYESVWVVLVPVQVTELLFAKRRDQLWLRRRGMIIASLVFLLGSRLAWYAWIKRVRPMIFHVPAYHPGAITIIAGLLAIVLLAIEAYLIRDKSHVIAGRSTPSAWMVGVVALALGFPWYWLMELQFSPQSKHPPFWIPMTVCVAWAGLAYLLYRRWTSSPQWSDLHRWTLSFAATLVCMLAGFLGSSSWSRVDLVGKILLNVVAMVGFLWLLRRMRQFAGS
jgi:hypothetical protein